MTRLRYVYRVIPTVENPPPLLLPRASRSPQPPIKIVHVPPGGLALTVTQHRRLVDSPFWKEYQEVYRIERKLVGTPEQPKASRLARLMKRLRGNQ